MIALCKRVKILGETTWECPNHDFVSNNSCIRFKKLNSEDNKTDFDVLCFPDLNMSEWNNDSQKLIDYGYSEWCEADNECFEDDDWTTVTCEGNNGCSQIDNDSDEDDDFFVTIVLE